MKLYTYRTTETNPHRNLALEEYLLCHHIEQECCIFYLWQNRHTVVIGKNQHCQNECNTSLLYSDGGTVARRSSGGGAVYHDLGNLNFTFLAGKGSYDLEKQLCVITTALSRLGIPAVAEGRNDICIEGKKISGNAFFSSKAGKLHHGTLMLAVDKDKLSKYLNVSQEKLRAKGVQSVRARVANLVDYRPDLTVEMLCAALLSAFEDVYGAKATALNESVFDQAELEKLYEKYASDDFIFGAGPAETHAFQKRFDWGNVDLRLLVENGWIKAAALYSDAMDSEYIAAFATALKGRPYTPAAFLAAAQACAQEDLYTTQMPRELLNFLLKEVEDENL